MPTYFDSSIVVSILAEDGNRAKANSLWEQVSQHRVSSLLLEAECVITLRRHFRNNQRQLTKNWLQICEDNLGNILKKITLTPLSPPVLKVLRQEKQLAECRSLDAIHLATLMYLQKFSDEVIGLMTFDKSMKHLGKKLKIPTLS